MSIKTNNYLSLVENILGRSEYNVLTGSVINCKTIGKIGAVSMKSCRSKISRCKNDKSRTGIYAGSSKALDNYSNKVFIVHGRDNEKKEACARILEKLNLEPVILQEQPNCSQMIFEKLENYTDVGYAVILMTHDDVGGLKGEPLSNRARQNVVLELGLLIEKLGRHRIAILMDEDIEIPSDINGIGYILIDSYGAWKMKLAQELMNANYDIDLKRFIS